MQYVQHVSYDLHVLCAAWCAQTLADVAIDCPDDETQHNAGME